MSLLCVFVHVCVRERRDSYKLSCQTADKVSYSRAWEGERALLCAHPAPDLILPPAFCLRPPFQRGPPTYSLLLPRFLEAGTW